MIINLRKIRIKHALSTKVQFFNTLFKTFKIKEKNIKQNYNI